MRLSSTCAAAVLGALVAGIAGGQAPLPRGLASVAPGAADRGAAAAGSSTPPLVIAPDIASSFDVAGSVRLEGRLGQPTLARDSDGQTYMMVALHGGERSGVTPPLRLAIVIDKSGSMRGARMANAITAASSVISRLRDTDTVTVVSFDTKSQIVVPPTQVTDSVRPELLAAVRNIRVGGDTCISCGLEEAMHQLSDGDAVDGAGSGSSSSRNQVRRMMLLSDGATNHGVRDIPGLRSIAGRSRDEGCAVSTVGLDVDFDEKVMGALASESNGKHYFVRNASDLTSIFGQELDALTATVASNAELTVDLAPGVALDEVVDRTFTRVSSSRIRIPFGSLSAHEDRTLLMKVRVPTGDLGSLPIAKVALHYRDIGASTDASVDGSLGLDVGGATAEMDPFVAARIERTRTAQTLFQVNDLLSKGQASAADALLDKEKDDLAHRRAVAFAQPSASGVARSQLENDFDGQTATLGAAKAAVAPAAQALAANGFSGDGEGFGSGGSGGGGAGRKSGRHFAPAPPASPSEVKAAIRQNNASAGPLAF